MSLFEYFVLVFQIFVLLKGERLSHAVGCAFAICLERKKRDAEASAAAVQEAISLSPLGCEKRSTTGFTLDEISKQTAPTSNRLIF